MKLVSLIRFHNGTIHAYNKETRKTYCGCAVYFDEREKLSYSGLTNVQCKRCLKVVQKLEEYIK